MAQVRLAPDLFVIKAISPERQKPENENYELRTQLNNGKWTPSAMGLKGTLEVKWFLNSNGVDEATINLAIEELSVSGQTTVRIR
jgi:hypothetical protein